MRSNSLEANGVKTVDCRRAGFSAAETTMQLRYFCENWRQPFQKDYTESSVRHSFEQLLALRADLEEALGRKEAARKPSPALKAPTVGGLGAHHDDDMLAMIGSTPTDMLNAPAVEPAVTKKETAARDRSDRSRSSRPSRAGQRCRKPRHLSRQNRQSTHRLAPTARCRSGKVPGTDLGTADCRAAFPRTFDVHGGLAGYESTAVLVGSRGVRRRRAVRNRKICAARSWRVRCWRSPATSASVREKKGALASALALARSEVSYFQGRVEQAKRAKNTEAAVNLGISTKRLLSCIEEAETLQS